MKPFLLLLSLMFIFLQKAIAADYHIYTEEWPPFNYTDSQGKLQGISVEITQAILNKLGESGNIKITSWKDAYASAQKQPNGILFTTSWTSSREKEWKWVGPISSLSAHLYFHPKSYIDIVDEQDLCQLKSIAIKKNDPIATYLETLGCQNIHFDTVENIYRKTASGEYGAFVGTEIVSEMRMRKYSLPTTAFVKSKLELFKQYLYIAFSKQTSQQVIDRWYAAFMQLKEDQVIDGILSRYLKQFEIPYYKLTDKVFIATHEWYPHYTLRHPYQHGIILDMMDQVLSKMGQRYELISEPWRRNLRLVEYDRVFASAAWAKTEKRSEKFLYTDSLMELTEYFYYLASRFPDGFDYDSVKELKRLRIGGIQGYRGFEKLKNERPENTIALKDEKSGFALLEEGQLDLFLAEPHVAYFVMQKKKELFKHTETPYVTYGSHLILNKTNLMAKEWINNFNRSLKVLQEEKSLTKIINSYKTPAYK